jgi:hypothetical protein
MTSNLVSRPAAIPTLSEIALEPGRAATLPPEAVTALLAQCVAVQGALLSRPLAAVAASPAGPVLPSSENPALDAVRTFTVPQVAKLVALPTGYLYEAIGRGLLPAFHPPALTRGKPTRYVRVRLTELRR